MHGWRRPIAPDLVYQKCPCPPFLVDGACRTITNVVQWSLPWTSRWSSHAAQRRTFLGTTRICSRDVQWECDSQWEWESHGNPMGMGIKCQNWEWKWELEGMGYHLNSNGNYLHSRGNLFPQIFLWHWCSFALCIVYNTKGTMWLNVKYEAEPDRERF